MDRNPTSHGSVYGHYLIFVFPFTICNLRRATHFYRMKKKKSTEAYFMVDDNYPEFTFQFYRNTAVCVCTHIVHSCCKWDWAVELSSVKSWASYVSCFHGFIALLCAPQNHYGALTTQKYSECHTLVSQGVWFYSLQYQSLSIMSKKEKKSSNWTSTVTLLSYIKFWNSFVIFNT